MAHARTAYLPSKAPTIGEGPRQASPRGRLSASLSPIKPEKFGYDQARHLLWRAGFGGTPTQIQTLASWGPQRAVDYMLDFDRVADEPVAGDLFDRNIMRPPTSEEREAYRKAQRAQDEDALARFRQERQRRERSDRSQMTEIQKWWLRRMIQTPRPLEEKMTLFWHTLLATSYRTIENSYHMFLQNMMFRRHATGNFGRILSDLIRDPAMIKYLDNDSSRKGRPNENLAREIMELFSLGIGNYTERDIKEGARALTGYTFRDDEFFFDARNHDNGEKTILGKRGTHDGDGFVRAILDSKACAAYIARRLYGFLAADLPPLERVPDRDLDPSVRAVLDGLTSTLVSGNYELKPMLRRLLLSEHFYDPANAGEQIKSPVVLVVGAIRSLNTPVRDLGILNDALDLMGQSIFFPPSVKGWEAGRSWINTSTIYVRQNILTYLLTGKKPVGYDATADSARFDPTGLLSELSRADASAANDPGRVVDYLLKLTLGGIPPAARESLVAFARSRGGTITPDVVTALLLVTTTMPEYQLC
ncbi:MAG: DUF1800 domain-containing protein [Phycisphaeraceae bacterium]|nr:DUF1800 domain-containing protein [Phycisphaerae bacterium]MBX3392086.1 DUF1800 domain-containing protein [Phycisphaeraceae bacterium]HRJ49140.1 DUF1800 domain-containing protein [Phycisphaerales bacterium]